MFLAKRKKKKTGRFSLLQELEEKAQMPNSNSGAAA